jgi:hypothetical protein
MFMNSEKYSDVLQNQLTPAIHRKRHHVPSSGVCLQHDTLSFNRTQLTVVTGLLTGRNTLRRHLYLMGLSSNITCRKYGTEVETSVRVLCECEVLASLRVPSFWNLKMYRI